MAVFVTIETGVVRWTDGLLHLDLRDTSEGVIANAVRADISVPPLDER